jgi:polysaccharide export outer membrane protein
LYVVAALFALCLSGYASGRLNQPLKNQPVSNPTLQRRFPRYRLQLGDSFEALFQFSPSFNQTLVVQPDGYIALKEMGDLHVAGLTLPEVHRLLLEKYSKILKNPVITLMPKDLDKSYFIASGEVAKPGKYQLRAPITVIEALAIAGGLAPDRAKLSQVVLFRRKGGRLAPGQVINIKKMLNRRDLAEDLYVHPGDLLYVPQSRLSKFHQIIPTSGVGMQMMPTY